METAEAGSDDGRLWQEGRGLVREEPGLYQNWLRVGPWVAVDSVSTSPPPCAAYCFVRTSNTWKLKQCTSKFPWVKEKKTQETQKRF